jgi:hypothetical protein
VLSSLEGINGTIFMYGQTGAGKTYTMLGDYSSEIMKKAKGSCSKNKAKTPMRNSSKLEESVPFSIDRMVF